MRFVVLAKRTVCILAVLADLASCGSAQSDVGNGRPKSPLDLPSVAANLDLTGPVSGHISEVRFDECKMRTKPDGNFYASIYFELQGNWYFLQSIAAGAIPVTGNHSGYSGPVRYQADVDFRDMKVYPGGMINGDHAWGGPIELLQTMTIAPDAHSVTVGSATGTPASHTRSGRHDPGFLAMPVDGKP